MMMITTILIITTTISGSKSDANSFNVTNTSWWYYYYATNLYQEITKIFRIQYLTTTTTYDGGNNVAATSRIEQQQQQDSIYEKDKDKQQSQHDNHNVKQQYQQQQDDDNPERRQPQLDDSIGKYTKLFSDPFRIIKFIQNDKDYPIIGDENYTIGIVRRIVSVPVSYSKIWLSNSLRLNEHHTVNVPSSSIASTFVVLFICIVGILGGRKLYELYRRRRRPLRKTTPKQQPYEMVTLQRNRTRTLSRDIPPIITNPTAIQQFNRNRTESLSNTLHRYINSLTMPLAGDINNNNKYPTPIRDRLNSSVDLYRDIAIQEDQNDTLEYSTNFYDIDYAYYNSYDIMDNASVAITPTNRYQQYATSTYPRIRYYGPAVRQIKYSTISPPPTWEVASRQLLMYNTTKWKLQRVVSLVLLPTKRSDNPTTATASLPVPPPPTMTDDGTIRDQLETITEEQQQYLQDTTQNEATVRFQQMIHSPATVVIREAQSHKTQPLTKSQRKELEAHNIVFPVQSISIHTKVPVEGAVLELYNCSNGNEESTPSKKIIDNDWKMEHTFSSAVAAAQFQIDLLGLQLLWPTIYHMYQALAIIHKGSTAYNGDEPVLHHTRNNGTSVSGGEGTDEATANAGSTVPENADLSKDNNEAKVDSTTVESSSVLRDMSNNIITEEESGIAWDDLMRCLGSSFPTVRKRLENLLWMATADGSIVDNNLHRHRRRRLPSHHQQQDQPSPRVRKGTVGSLGSNEIADANAAVNPTNRPTNDAKPRSTEPKNTVDVYAADRLTQHREIGTNIASTTTTQLEPEYTHKRLILGPVDLYRLFVPLLPETALPIADSNRYRVEQMIRWRKRVARASVLVQAYCRARIIANQGWHIVSPERSLSLTDDDDSMGYLKRRFAYDDNLLNRLHDSTVTDQYYEGTVSRDVICMVRDEEFLRPPPNTLRDRWDFVKGCILGDEGIIPFSRDNVRRYKSSGALSLYQGFTLVGMHLFDFPNDDNTLPLHYKKDPVQCIPSLRKLIYSNPDLEFFVHAMFLMPRNATLVKVFVRSLPKGIDPKFDTVVTRFFKGDSELRKRKLEILLQLGIDRSVMSLAMRCILWLFSLILRLTLIGQSSVKQSIQSDDRTSIPAINLTLMGDNYHFGGASCKDASNPGNYVSSTLYMHSQRQNSYVAKVLLSFISGRYITENVTDVSYNLAGESKDELPERVLATSRHVRLRLQKKIALSSISAPSNSSINLESNQQNQYEEAPPTQYEGLASLCLRIFVTDPLVATANAIVRGTHSEQQSDANGDDSRMNRLSPLPSSPFNLFRRSPMKLKSEKAAVVATVDPFEQAVNELIHILDGVRVPVRKDQLATSDLKKFNPNGGRTGQQSDDEETKASLPYDEIVQVSILRRMSRADIQRFFIASNCSLKTAAVRIVQSAAWQGLTFPIDTRSCRVELQNGQFFQQGCDNDGNPVFYYRNMLLGPWRKDEDAIIAAVLHRFETSLRTLDAQARTSVRCTLVVVMGKPFVPKKRKKKAEIKTLLQEQQKLNEKKPIDGAASVPTATITETTYGSVNGGQSVGTEGEETAVTIAADGLENDTTKVSTMINNPRIPSDEQWYVHGNKSVLQRLIQLMMLHYPERVHKVLVVVGHGNTSFVRSAVGGALLLGSVIPSSRTREKIKFVTRYRDLQNYIPPNELLVLVGGTQPSKMQHFEC